MVRQPVLNQKVQGFSFAKKKTTEVKPQLSSLTQKPVIRTSIGETRPEIANLLEKCLESGASLGKEVIVGVNSVCRAIEKCKYDMRDKIKICLSKDTNPSYFLKHISDMALAKSLCIVVIPKFRKELAKTLKLKSASCFAIQRSDLESDLLAPKLDAICEYIENLHEKNINSAH